MSGTDAKIPIIAVNVDSNCLACSSNRSLACLFHLVKPLDGAKCSKIIEATLSQNVFVRDRWRFIS